MSTRKVKAATQDGRTVEAWMMLSVFAVLALAALGFVVSAIQQVLGLFGDLTVVL